jgi:hypothetical protein
MTGDRTVYRWLAEFYGLIKLSAKVMLSAARADFRIQHLLISSSIIFHWNNGWAEEYKIPARLVPLRTNSMPYRNLQAYIALWGSFLPSTFSLNLLLWI